MKMSELIVKTTESKVNAKKNGYEAILTILEDQDKIKKAEIFPGSVLTLTLVRGYGDRIQQAIDQTGSCVLNLDNSQVWRLGCQDAISIQFNKLDDIDKQWNLFIDELKNRAEML
jgi:hypothetical protein